MAWHIRPCCALERRQPSATSADQIVPELQHLEVGEVLLDGANCDATHGAWTVCSIQPGRSLVLFSSRTLDGREVDPRAETKPRLFFDCSWAFVLVPEGEGATRLLVRSRLRMVPGWALHGAGFLRLGDTVWSPAGRAGSATTPPECWRGGAPRSSSPAARRTPGP